MRDLNLNMHAIYCPWSLDTLDYEYSTWICLGNLLRATGRLDFNRPLRDCQRVLLDDKETIFRPRTGVCSVVANGGTIVNVGLCFMTCISWFPNFWYLLRVCALYTRLLCRTNTWRCSSPLFCAVAESSMNWKDAKSRAISATSLNIVSVGNILTK